MNEDVLEEWAETYSPARLYLPTFRRTVDYTSLYLKLFQVRVNVFRAVVAPAILTLNCLSLQS